MFWISHPLVYYGLLAAGLGFCLYLFGSVKQENARLRQKMERQQQQCQALLREFRGALDAMEQSLQEHEQNEEVTLPSPATPGQSINLTRRSQALRMYRRGGSPEQICAALQMPRNEVELLLKVHKALTEQPC